MKTSSIRLNALWATHSAQNAVSLPRCVNSQIVYVPGDRAGTRSSSAQPDFTHPQFRVYRRFKHLPCMSLRASSALHNGFDFGRLLLPITIFSALRARRRSAR
ncbi:hypothetical protein KCP78_12640 [Salmonella enterica subsp. enterica]|nr:hypothetical protein KCP78_12640 [Salmonella enterica subsp. enterica]